MENSKVYQAGMYVRLSKEDSDVVSAKKAESDSIQNQKLLIRDFVKDKPDIEIVREYEDDGYTGSDFDRPGFQTMMDDVRKGVIDCVIVKDFSRLGRDHLETGNLLERIFPLLRIRFISVNDVYDSADCDGMTGGLTVALKNVMNAMYSRDLSGKVRSAMTTRAKNGQYMAAKVPYGYKKDPDDVHRLVIDEEAAKVVRMIFGFAAEGKTKGWIKGYLNTHDILTPSEYLIAHGGKVAGRRNKENPRWTMTTIADMLRNQAYIGNTCWNKSAQNISTGKKMVKNGKDDWIVAENTHEPIVSKEIFDRANALAFTGQHKKIKGGSCPLIYCAYCGRTMAAPKDGNHIRYRCMNGYGEFAEEDCKKARIKAKDLESTVLANVNLMVDIYAEQKKKLQKSASEASAISDRINSLSKERDRLTARKSRLYEEYRNGGSREEYIQKKKQTEERISEIAVEIQEAECQLEVAKQNDEAESQTDQVLSEVLFLETFDKACLKKIIERVNVYDEDKIEIIWKPMDALFQSITDGGTEIKI